MTAGAELFTLHGFGGTRVQKIARQARANKAMISYYFGGKQGLYQAILVDTFGAVEDRFETIRKAQDGADVRLRRFVDLLASVASQRPAFAAMVLREVLSGGRQIDDRVWPLFLSVFRLVRDIVEQGVREGTFRRVDAFHTHLGLLGSVLFYFATVQFRQKLAAEGKLPVKLPRQDQYIRHIQDLMIRGLARAESRRG
ncbi:MAG: TetR/AcrR family transcriptional regulator [Acidobacteria bacterium]|nr:TetR/AcrR family transcriptional regulator [Acidobacteriota bacterium]